MRASLLLASLLVAYAAGYVTNEFVVYDGPSSGREKNDRLYDRGSEAEVTVQDCANEVGSLKLDHIVTPSHLPSQAEPEHKNTKKAERNLVNRRKIRAISESVSALPEVQIRAFLRNFFNLRNSDIRDIRNINEYAKKVIGILAKNDSTENTKNLSFSREAMENDAPLNPTDQFYNNHTERIYAWFDNPEGPVLVKWFNSTTGETLLFNRFATTETGRQFVWRQPKDSWPAGKYTVAVYDAKSLNLLSQGRFTVH